MSHSIGGVMEIPQHSTCIIPETSAKMSQQNQRHLLLLCVVTGLTKVYSITFISLHATVFQSRHQKWFRLVWKFINESRWFENSEMIPVRLKIKNDSSRFGFWKWLWMGWNSKMKGIILSDNSKKMSFLEFWHAFFYIWICDVLWICIRV